MDDVWEIDRIKLYFLRRDHPSWTQANLARELGRSLSWVKKWLKRFREVGHPSLETFKSLSRAPKRRSRQISELVRDAILSLRDQLKDKYGRVVGSKTILYHLHQDPFLKKNQMYVPRSARTIWKVLREGGRILRQIREHHPVERPDPMQHWEMDFGQIGNSFEFLTVVDRGTSILVNTQAQNHYNAETALMAVARLLLLNGLPQKLRFDNDPRFVGNWLTDGYPSPLMRFLLCLDVEPDLVEPGKPYHKPFVERSVRTLKHECLWVKHPQSWLDVGDILETYRQFYNHDRANQSSACNNRPPYEAFPQLSSLPYLPDWVNPDAWVDYYHQRVFNRKVDRNGRISVGTHNYHIGYQHGGKHVGVFLDADHLVFKILLQGQVVCEKEIQGIIGYEMSFSDYLKHMLKEAETQAD